MERARLGPSEGATITKCYKICSSVKHRWCVPNAQIRVDLAQRGPRVHKWAPLISISGRWDDPGGTKGSARGGRTLMLGDGLEGQVVRLVNKCRTTLCPVHDCRESGQWPDLRNTVSILFLSYMPKKVRRMVRLSYILQSLIKWQSLESNLTFVLSIISMSDTIVPYSPG